MDAKSTETKKWYRKRVVIIGMLVVAIPVVAFGWWLFSPLLFDKTVSEEFPRAASAQIPQGATLEDVEAAMVKAESEATTAADDMPSDGPVQVSVGQLVGADSFHQGSGSATIYTLADGSNVLRFENLDVTNGPDLHVILSPVAMAEGRDDVMASGYVDLGSLKGNLGDQNYDIPADVDVEAGEWTVVIYCQPFHVIFATAPLTTSAPSG